MMMRESKIAFAYGTNYLIDTKAAVIVDVEPSPARWTAEVAASRFGRRSGNGSRASEKALSANAPMRLDFVTRILDFRTLSAAVNHDAGDESIGARRLTRLLL
jgi:hypothetical protein